MTFTDIFKNNFLDEMANLSALQVGLTLFISFIIGLFIYQIYKRTFQGVIYTRSFNVSLIMIAMVTSLVIMAVTSNVILSLGMVGALSIVRFRTAIKDPMDIVFMFWSIAVGIVTGAGLYLLAILGSFIIGMILIIFFNLKDKSHAPYLLIINYTSKKVEKDIFEKIKAAVKKYNIKAKTVSKDNVEMTLELRVQDELTFINELIELNGVANAVLVSYNGDYVS